MVRSAKPVGREHAVSRSPRSVAISYHAAADASSSSRHRALARRHDGLRRSLSKARGARRIQLTGKALFQPEVAIRQV
jgi:hypothetical protein